MRTHKRWHALWVQTNTRTSCEYMQTPAGQTEGPRTEHTLGVRMVTKLGTAISGLSTLPQLQLSGQCMHTA